MAAPNLNTLPADILLIICQYLARTTLRDLSLVDSQSHVAARKVLFASITIRAQDVVSDTTQCISILQRNSTFQAVRHLRIDEDQARIFSRICNIGTYDFGPAVDFVSLLSSLSSLSWACSQQFPQPLLDLLQQRLPSCRLHLKLSDFSTSSTPRKSATNENLSRPRIFMRLASPWKGFAQEHPTKEDLAAYH